MAQHADWAGAAFGKITVVYGHIDENGAFVRNWLARKKAITDKMGKNSRLSVKCVLLTDKSVKKGTLSVNLTEFLPALVEQCPSFSKDSFFAYKKLKRRTKSVATRPPSFVFSFNSSGKRNFFPSLFSFCLFLTSPWYLRQTSERFFSTRWPVL